MYIIGILIGLYLKISIVFLCLILVVSFVLLENLYDIIIYKLGKKIKDEKNTENNENIHEKVKNVKFKKRKHFILLSFIIFGIMHIKYLDTVYEKKYIDVSDKINVKGVIVLEPQDKEYKYTYTINVREINGQTKYKNTKLIININKNKLNNAIPKFGDEIEVSGKFKIPNSARNYKGFNYKQYLKSKKIYGTITANTLKINKTDSINKFEKLLNYVQNNMKDNISSILNKNESALCMGILIGDRESISEDIENNFENSNLMHMLAVSGAHITYIINALAIILSKVSKKQTKIITIIILLFFMALTGFTPSVIRACIMGILVITASLIYKKSDTINNLGISAFIILIFNPYLITNLGFLLSYGGTIGIILLNDKLIKLIYHLIEKVSNGKIKYINSNLDDKKFKEKNSLFYKVIQYIVNSFSITLSANLIIIPIMAYNFSKISLTFWISNILAAPIMEIVTILGFIVYFISFIFIPFAKYLGIFLEIFLDLLLKIAEITAKIPGASIYVKTPRIIECIMYYFDIFIMLYLSNVKNFFQENKYIRHYIKFNKNPNMIFNLKIFKEKCKKCHIYRKIKKIIIIIIIIVLIVVIEIKYISNQLKIYFVDVGQGDCTLIQTPLNKNILIDGGGSEFGDFDVGKNILLPYLLDRRVTTIDYMIISHFDSDHIAGLFYIMENLKVKNIIISKQGENSLNFQKLNKIVKLKNINVIIVKNGNNIQIDKNTYFEILFPEEKLIKNNVLNNNSIVTKFNYMNFSILFTGDIEEEAEKRMYEMYKDNNKLSSTILKVAHHGSKTSSTEKFLELVNPKIALIGVGADNKFGHPNNNVLDRIKNYTNYIYRTDICGEITIIVEKNGKIKIRKFF